MPDKIELKAASPATEYNSFFMQGMLDRMAMSYHKYGPVSKGFPEHVDAVQSALQRLREYARTKNTEFLIDAANFMMIEFMHPRIPEAKFISTDDSASPGRIKIGGGPTKKNNEEIAED